MKYAYVTTLNSDNYLIGAINVARKIKEFSKYPFYIIINSEIEKKYSNLFKKLHIETILMENIELSECIINNMKDTVYGHWIFLMQCPL